MRRDELIGTTIANRFHVKRVLGEGGMATVYVAEQQAEPREVALKILKSELTSDKTFAKRFDREAKAAARVQHPNSVKILDAGVAGGLSYIAMELLQGDDLYALLERHGVLSPRAATTILAEVCDALAVAHALGIVHRDLKPENIMIVRTPSVGAAAAAAGGAPKSVPLPAGAHVKVLDFGIAKLLDTQSDAPRPLGSRLDPPSAVTAVTRVGTLIGTPSYMSPEQCAQLPLDGRSDIYTCGVLLYQMVTGQLPFEGATPLHVATKHIHEDPPPLRSIVPEAHPELEAIIVKAMAKRSTDRHASARILATALRKLLPELPDTAYPSVGGVGGAEPAVAPSAGGVAAAPFSVDVPVSIPEPGALSSAKTMVADGPSGPPPSVLVREPEPPRRALMILARHPVPGAPGAAPGEAAAPATAAAQPAPTAQDEGDEAPAPGVEAEPEDLASTLVRGDREPVVIPSAAASGRQVTMQSAAPAAAPVERAARIAIVEAPQRAAAAAPVAVSVAAPAAATVTAPLGVVAAAGPSPAPVRVPVHQAPPPMPTASVILSPSVAAPQPPAPPAAAAPTNTRVGGGTMPMISPAIVADLRQAAPAPTFGLPPAATSAKTAPATVPASTRAGRVLWLGILIGILLSGLLFVLAYVLFLSR